MKKEENLALDAPPESILIIGAGVFGLSTALTLLQSKRYEHTNITIVDAYAPDPDSLHTTSSELNRPETTASLDTSRIVRPDYNNRLYAALADEATGLFRSGWAEGIDVPERTYTQPGLLLISSGLEDGRGRAYLRAAHENTLKLAHDAKTGQSNGLQYHNSGSKPISLPNSKDVEQVLGSNAGTLPELVTGYINPQAGWANASAAISAVKHKVLNIGREREAQGKATFRFLSGTKVSSLLFSDDKTSVIGASLGNDKQIKAATTILATGAWSSTLLPSLLSPRLRASGQVLAYIPLNSAQEVSHYAGKPTVLDMESGMFAIFPPKHYLEEQRENGHVKIARHGWGYEYSLNIKDPITSEDVSCYLPVENQKEFFTIPSEGIRACREFTSILLPELKDRAFSHGRICWYTDTPTSDFLIDLIPDLNGVLIASGGSGHGFKFLPVIGDKVVARLEGRLDAGLADLWRWRSQDECHELWKGDGDHSRGGQRGMKWEEEIAKGSS